MVGIRVLLKAALFFSCNKICVATIINDGRRAHLNRLVPAFQANPICFRNRRQPLCHNGGSAFRENDLSQVVISSFHRGGEKKDPDVFVLQERKGRKKLSFSRAGGRARQRKAGKSTNSGEQLNPIAVVVDLFKKALPLLIILTIMKSIFSFILGGGNNNILYYSSSVYEKTFYDENGEIQKLRKENIQSNVPSLITNDNLLRGIGERGYSKVDSYLESLEEDLQNLDREVDNIYRSAISDDFF